MKFNILILVVLLTSCTNNNSISTVKVSVDKSTPTTNNTEWELAFKISDLAQPESVAYDESRNVLFVSNQNQGKEGFISLLSINGSVIEREWVNGLVNPKGIKVVDDKLYVSDETVLVEIDINKATIIKKYEGEGSRFLNDVEADSNGNIYASDMLTSSIFKLDKNGNFTNWLQSPELEYPNGLLIKNNALYLAPWGTITDGNILEAAKGSLLKASLNDKKITKVSYNSIGNLDGLQHYNDGFLISDWINGNIYTFSNGKHHKIIETTQGSGDIAYVADQDRIYIPMALENEVLVYQKKNVEKPIGVKRDGSYYTRVEWTNATLTTPLYWVNNINDDDTSRNGGSWAAPVAENAGVILSFFGETQTVGKIKIFHNVGATISPLDELASKIKIYTSNDPNLQRIGDEKADVSKFNWTKIVSTAMEQKEGWVTLKLKEPIKARYIRLQLIENFGTPPNRSFIETNEIKLYKN